MQCKSGNKEHVWNAQRKVPNQLQKILSVNFRTPDIITARILLYNFFTKVKKFFTKVVPKISKCLPTPPSHPFC